MYMFLSFIIIEKQKKIYRQRAMYNDDFLLIKLIKKLKKR